MYFSFHLLYKLYIRLYHWSRGGVLLAGTMTATLVPDTRKTLPCRQQRQTDTSRQWIHAVWLRSFDKQHLDAEKVSMLWHNLIAALLHAAWRKIITTLSLNKSAQSILGRGPRRVANVRREVPIGYNGAPQICPQKHSFPRTDPQTPLPISSLDPSDLRRQTVSSSDAQFFHIALDKPTHRRTDRQIVHGKVWWLQAAAPLTRATRPNNNSVQANSESVQCRVFQTWQ